MGEGGKIGQRAQFAFSLRSDEQEVVMLEEVLEQQTGRSQISRPSP